MAVGASPLRAQSDGFMEKDQRVVSAGYMALGDYEGSGVGIAAEWGVARLSSRLTLGLGGFAGLQRNTEPFGAVQLTSTTIPVMGIANVHLNSTSRPKLDLYAGMSTGLTRVTVSGAVAGIGIPDESGTSLSVGAQLGARYAMLRRLSLMGQLGFGDLPFLYGGLSLKL